MPTHFLDLQGAVTLATQHYQLTARIVDDLVEHAATGVVHGPAGLGKTFAVDAALERLRAQTEHAVVSCSLAFPSKPTMLQVATDLVTALSGARPARARNRFQLISHLVGLLAAPARLIVVDEAQRLNGECIELLRHLHDHHETRFALLYVGGDGCWEVLSAEPMLRSRIFRRLPFKPVPRAQVPALMRRYHPIYADAAEELLLDIDDVYAHGTLRDWAVFTHTAAALAADAGRRRRPRHRGRCRGHQRLHPARRGRVARDLSTRLPGGGATDPQPPRCWREHRTSVAGLAVGGRDAGAAGDRGPQRRRQRDGARLPQERR